MKSWEKWVYTGRYKKEKNNNNVPLSAIHSFSQLVTSWWVRLSTVTIKSAREWQPTSYINPSDKLFIHHHPRLWKSYANLLSRAGCIYKGWIYSIPTRDYFLLLQWKTKERSFFSNKIIKSAQVFETNSHISVYRCRKKIELHVFAVKNMRKTKTYKTGEKMDRKKLGILGLEPTAHCRSEPINI